MSTKPLMPLAGRIKFTEGEPYEDGSLGKKVKDIDDSVANETSDRQYADAVIQNQLNEETLHLVPNYISNANTFFTAGAGKTNTATTGLPPEVSAYEHDKWGTIFYLPENEEERTGTQIYHCIAYNGSPNRGKIYKRLIISGIPTAWELVGAGSGGNVTTIVETIDDAPENPQIGDRITVLQDGSTDSVPMSAVIGLINALNGKQNLLPIGTNNGDILLWDASQNKYVSKPKWQMIYQPVEYVQNQFYETSTTRRTSYINTGIIPQIGDVWTLEFSLTTSSRSNISGVTVFTLEPYRMYGLVIREEQMWFYNLNQTWIVLGNADTNKHTIVGNTATGKIYFDGTEIDAPSEANSEHPLYLFCCNNGAGVREDLANVKIYYTKYERNGAKLFEYYPAYSLIDGKIGMFETVTNTFVESANKSYPFLKGADI